jgi:hypothetical protein
MTLTTCDITLAGVQMTGAKDTKGTYYLVVPALEKALEWRANSGREKLRSKSLEAFAGKVLSVGKKKADKGGSLSIITVEDANVILGWAAKEGNEKAFALLLAASAESFRRRIDSALNVETTEEEYERRTHQFFRELARKSFLPEFTSHLQQAEVCPNYGAEVNKLKQAAALPIKSIEDYSAKEIEGWSKAITRYDALRMEGYGHKRTLQRIAHVTQARLN